MQSLYVLGASQRLAAALLFSSVLGCSPGDATGDRGAQPGTDAAVPNAAADATARGMLDASLLDSAVDAGPPCVEPEAGLPSDVFCTGLYKGRDPKTHADEAKPYTPGVKFWSDGAQKDRFLYLPPHTQIDTSDLDAWKFPVGTKAWKEFHIDGKLVETRIFWKRSAAKWESGTYLWDESETNATLNTSLRAILLPNGYEIPNARDCGKCHHGGSDSLLGVEAVALALPMAEGETLSKLIAAGALSHPPVRKIVKLPEDSTGKAAAALGYLHVNCGMPCHSTRGLGDETLLVMRLRAEELFATSARDAGALSADAAVPSADAGASSADASGPSGNAAGPASVVATDTYRATVNQAPTTMSVAQKFPGAHRVVPGNHEQSLLWQLAHVRGNYQMPPLVSHKVDDVGTQQLADWIDALPH
ncbi:MAG: hypothetical protein RLZZ450_7195 [Pseudomonadota bacterium]|jgi:hypothetical protein